MSLKYYMRDLDDIEEDVEKVEKARRILDTEEVEDADKIDSEIRTKEYAIEDDKYELIQEIKKYELGETLNQEEFEEIEDLIIENRFREAKQLLEKILTR